MSPPRIPGDGSDRDAAAIRRLRRVLAVAVLLPFAVSAAVSVGALGRDARAAFGDELVVAAERAAASIGAALRAAEPAVAEADRAAAAAALAALQSAGEARFEFAYFSAAGGYTTLAMPAAGPPEAPARGGDEARADRLPDPLPAATVRELESLDRAFATRLGRRFAGVAPVKDADQWDLRGAAVVRSRLPDPPLFPPLAAGLAAFAFGLTALSVLAFARRPLRSRLAPVFAPGVALCAILVATAPPGFSQWSGDHGFWTITAFAAWAVVAGIGLSFAHLARRPLALGEAARAWVFLAPSFLHLLVFSVGPILFALWLSFHQWNLLEASRPFVGWANYRELAADGDFWRAIRNTAVYVLFVPVGMVVALALALLVNRRIPGVRMLRTFFFLPYITSFVAISLVWRWMFQPDFGLLNRGLALFGIPAQPWLSSPATAMPSLMLMSVWMYAGYMMVIFLAGLQNIPESLYESARIDGAGPWQRFTHITLPMLRPTTLFVLVTMVIFMFQVFTAVYVMTEGGPLHATDVVVYHIYRAAWEYLRMGYASAMAWVLFAIIFLITLIQFRWLGARPTQ